MMENKKRWLLHLFIFLFSASVPVAVLPIGIVNAYGLFDEVTSSFVTEDKDSEIVRFLYKGIIINHNKKPSQPTLKRRFFKKKAAFFHGPVWERSGADFILKRKGEFF